MPSRAVSRFLPRAELTALVFFSLLAWEASANDGRSGAPYHDPAYVAGAVVPVTYGRYAPRRGYSSRYYYGKPRYRYSQRRGYTSRYRRGYSNRGYSNRGYRYSHQYRPRHQRGYQRYRSNRYPTYSYYSRRG